MAVFKKVYTLRQMTPMIHFQYGEDGATLRASEVKPKLDRFVADRLAAQGRPVPVEWFVSRQQTYPGTDGKVYGALKYKMTFHAEGGADIARVEHPLDLTHIGKKQHAFSVHCTGSLGMQILCFEPELAQALDEAVFAFFATNNFGKRASKGFGSFKLVDQQKDLFDAVKSVYPAGFAYIDYSRLTTVTTTDIFNDTNILYHLMKNGINFRGDYFKGAIFTYCKTGAAKKAYFKGAGINNEKSFYKSRLLHIDAAIQGEHQGYDPGQEDRYIRAVLGFGEGFSYPKASQDHFVNKYIATVPVKEGVDRFRSAVTFKYIDGLLLILPENCAGILGREFSFEVHDLEKGAKKKVDNPKTLKIKTPEAFNMPDFILWFSGEFNSQLNSGGSALNTMRNYWFAVDETTEYNQQRAKFITPIAKQHRIDVTLQRIKQCGCIKEVK